MKQSKAFSHPYLVCPLHTQLDRVGVSSEPEVAGGERLRGAQSHNDLLNAQVSVDSPATSQRRRVESRDKRGGLLGLLKRKTVGGKRGRKGKERREGEEEGEREEGGEGERGGEGPSFLTASMSLPNIAGELYCSIDPIRPNIPETFRVYRTLFVLVHILAANYMYFSQ